VFTALVASLDEWHQTFLPSRTGAFRDVVLDTIGALCMQAVVIAVVRYRSPRLES
jgi:VanZ family protein